MIYERPYKYDEFMYLSTNRQHRLQDVYSLLTKSMCRNDERLALYAAKQIPYPQLLKKRLMSFMCEFMPNFHALCSVYMINAKNERYKLEEWVVKLCRLVKTRVVCNAYRIVSIEQAKNNSTVSINDVKYVYQPYQYTHFLTDSELDNANTEEETIGELDNANTEEETIDESFKAPITSNDELTPDANESINIDSNVKVQYVPAITIEEEKQLINNAYTVFKLVCRDGYKKTIYSILKSISEHMLRGFKRNIIYHIFKYLNKRNLYIVFIFLALTSLRFATAIDHLGFDNIIDPTIYNNIPDYIALPTYVFDLDAMAPINSSYEYYIDNMVMTPTSEPTKIDKFGIQKFIQISRPLNSALTYELNIKNIDAIYVARLKDISTIALCSTHVATDSSPHKYRRIIHLIPIEHKSLMLGYVLSDYIKSKLYLPFTNRRIISYHNKYYLIEDNTILTNLDPDEFSKDYMNRTVYNSKLKSFYPDDIPHYIDDEDLMIKLFKMIIS